MKSQVIQAKAFLKVYTRLYEATEKEWPHEEKYKNFKSFVTGAKMAQKDLQHVTEQQSVEKGRRLTLLCLTSILEN
jgi:uncharacterized protein YktA (UPF0223 family)